MITIEQSLGIVHLTNHRSEANMNHMCPILLIQYSIVVTKRYANHSLHSRLIEIFTLEKGKGYLHPPPHCKTPCLNFNPSETASWEFFSGWPNHLILLFTLGKTRCENDVISFQWIHILSLGSHFNISVQGDKQWVVFKLGFFENVIKLTAEN